MSNRPMLVVEHESQCPPAWMGTWLEEAGASLDIRRPYAGSLLPGDLSGHDAMVVLGGAMSASDDATHPWLPAVRHLVRTAVEDRVPVLGICLGHQLCAAALGGEVRPNPRGQQMGVLDVGWTDAAADDQLFGPLARPSRAVQWNDDVVTSLPPGCVVLAETPDGEIQAARFAPTVWGVQWHPEVDDRVIRPWADNDRDRVRERGVDVEAYVASVASARDELHSTWRRLAESFVRQLTAAGVGT